MSAQHTPGPWATHEDVDGMACSIRSGDKTIARVVCIDSSMDASLIAAAPELLAALQRASAYLEENIQSLIECETEPATGQVSEAVKPLIAEDKALLAQVKAAIAKATAP